MWTMRLWGCNKDDEALRMRTLWRWVWRGCGDDEAMRRRVLGWECYTEEEALMMRMLWWRVWGWGAGVYQASQTEDWSKYRWGHVDAAENKTTEDEGSMSPSSSSLYKGFLWTSLNASLRSASVVTWIRADDPWSAGLLNWTRFSWVRRFLQVVLIISAVSRSDLWRAISFSLIVFYLSAGTSTILRLNLRF